MTHRLPANIVFVLLFALLGGATLAALAVTGTGASTPATAASQITAGNNHNCAVVDGAALCWGANGSGQLGVGTSTGPDMCTNVGSDEGPACSPVPVTVTGLSSGVLQVSAGDDNTCALLDDGTVRCWGRNDFGQLGIGTNSGPEMCDDGFAGTPDDCSTTPVTVQGLENITQISVGGSFACALDNERTVKCWGTNRFGQLGGDVSLSSSGVGASGNLEQCGGFPCATVPVDVPGLQASAESISAGPAHACVTTVDETVMCWGWQRRGRLGNGVANDDYPSAPVQVPGLGNVALVYPGSEHTCVLLTSDSVRCWGGNGFGQLGTGDSNQPQECGFAGSCSLTPLTPVGLGADISVLSDIESLHACVNPGGDILCWGRNNLAALGVPGGGPEHCPNPCSMSPIEMEQSPTDVVQITTGSNHTCALRVDGGVECWGHGFFGQRGDGWGGGGLSSSVTTHLPQQVVGILGGATPAPTEPPPIDLIWGDWDCSGEIDGNDPLLVIATLAGLNNNGVQASGINECPFVGQQGGTSQWGDINCSEGDVDLKDALDLFVHLAGIELTGVPEDCPAPGQLVS
jgi:alpha-tubulin suppressor-like RCC1 family protein